MRKSKEGGPQCLFTTHTSKENRKKSIFFKEKYKRHMTLGNSNENHVGVT